MHWRPLGTRICQVVSLWHFGDGMGGWYACTHPTQIAHLLGSTFTGPQVCKEGTMPILVAFVFQHKPKPGIQ